MIRKFAFVAVLAFCCALASAESRLLRHPTYSKGKVAFSYLGDIWIANEDGSNIQRLTVHKARDIYPRFSPDGKWIAFSSNREGNYDVYIIPAEGGRPKQLTFHAADDIVIGWTPDGKKVIFQSTRGAGVFPSVGTLYEVPIDGGTEVALPIDWGSSASYSLDGSKLAFTRHPGVWSRKHYRGSYNVDLWVMDVAKKTFKKLAEPDYRGNYYWPMYGANGDIYYVADRLPSEKGIKPGSSQVMTSINNIYKISERGGTPVQVTHHPDGNLFFPSISADRKTIVYEENFGLWKLDVTTGQNTRIPIDIKSDVKDNEIELRTYAEAEGLSISPSAKRAAISTHGEIFTIATDRGDVQRVTDTFWRESEPRWSPDGKWIAFISDRTGREEIWIADERGRNVKQISDADCNKSSVVWAADSKTLLWEGSDHKLRRVDIGNGKTDVLVESAAGPIGTPQFSPDMKWISYSKLDELLRSHVFVKPLDGGPERKIDSDEFLTASGAKWTPDGKRLLLIGGIGAPAMASLNRTTTQLYVVEFTKTEKNPDERDIDTEAQAEATPAPAPADGAPSGFSRFRRFGDRGPTSRPTTEPATRPGGARGEVRIEWDGLDKRIRQFTRVGGSVYNIIPSPDGRMYAFVASGDEGDTRGPALYTISEDGSRLTRLVDGTTAEPTDGSPRGRGGFGGGFADVQWTKDGRTIYYRQGGAIYSVNAPGGGGGESAPAPTMGGRSGRGFRGMSSAAPAPTEGASSSSPRRINFSIRMQVDTAAERRQVFEEAWRVMKFRFYDPNMHGVNWAAARETYEPLLADIADTEELHNLIMQMIGELNASHTGMSGGESAVQVRADTRYPGFDLYAGHSGYYKVGYIYKNGPANHEYIKLPPNSYILALNGKELRTSENYWKRFNLVSGRKFELTVNSKPQLEGAWTVNIEPITGGAQSVLDYDRWVESRKTMTDKLSGGQIGYLHIKAMDAPSLIKFQRDLLANQNKKALIIDQRFNGGGGIDQELLQILNQRKAYQSTRGRDSLAFPRPVQAFFGPMAVLQNERSASDAEMFPDGFRTLGLGKLVGMPTYGAVIGTGSYRLLDGSAIRTPGFGVYTARGENMENYGVQPDFMVDNTPADFLAGRDMQVEKAVEVLKAQIKP